MLFSKYFHKYFLTNILINLHTTLLHTTATPVQLSELDLGVTNNEPKTQDRFSDIVDKLDELALTGSSAANKDVFLFDKEFDIKGNDLMVYLHIQKTGGTSFGRQLVDRLRSTGTRHKKLCQKVPGMSRRTCARFMVEDPQSDDGEIGEGFGNV